MYSTWRFGECLIKFGCCVIFSTQPSIRPTWREAGGCCGNQSLWRDQGCQGMTDRFYFAKDQTLYVGTRKRGKCRLVKAQVELSHSQIGSDCDRFALFRSVLSGWNAWHKAATGASETARVTSICAALLFAPSNDTWLTFRKYIGSICTGSSRASEGIMYLI